MVDKLSEATLYDMCRNTPDAFGAHYWVLQLCKQFVAAVEDRDRLKKVAEAAEGRIASVAAQLAGCAAANAEWSKEGPKVREEIERLRRDLAKERDDNKRLKAELEELQGYRDYRQASSKIRTYLEEVLGEECWYGGTTICGAVAKVVERWRQLQAKLADEEAASLDSIRHRDAEIERLQMELAAKETAIKDLTCKYSLTCGVLADLINASPSEPEIKRLKEEIDQSQDTFKLHLAALRQRNATPILARDAANKRAEAAEAKLSEATKHLQNIAAFAAEQSPPADSYPLRGTAVRLDRPTEPVEPQPKATPDETVSQRCRREHYQQCDICDDLGCGDNATVWGGELRRLKKELAEVNSPCEPVEAGVVQAMKANRISFVQMSPKGSVIIEAEHRGVCLRVPGTTLANCIAELRERRKSDG